MLAVGRVCPQMLQPLQIKDVSLRYVKEIAELRDFLMKAGFAVGTSGTLRSIVARLPQDGSFRRDLTSHVWVLIDEGNRQISVADLLGMVAIAASGAQFAAVADEKDAHDLLRFLMEARHSLGAASVRSGAPVAWAAGPSSEVSVQLPPSFGETPSVEAPPEDGGKRKSVVWLVVAACVLVALSIFVWLTHRPTAALSSAPASVPPASTETSQPTSPAERGDASPGLSGNEPTAQSVMHSPNVARNPRSRPISAPPPSTLRTDIPPGPTTPTTLGQARTQAMGTVSTPGWTTNSSSSPNAPPSAPRSTGTAKPAFAGIPSTTLSKNLGSRSIPEDSSQGADSAASNRPRLLRRRPLTPSSSLTENDANVVAEVRPTSGSVASGASGTGGFNTNRVGTVRPTSLGIMAAYIQYSPVPTYPTAASAAHVQGEVTVRADVDRDGNVASARVISGPPLLRDAALDAVQHWRYRPYISSGKAAPMTATAIINFQLPQQ